MTENDFFVGVADFEAFTESCHASDQLGSRFASLTCLNRRMRGVH